MLSNNTFLESRIQRLLDGLIFVEKDCVHVQCMLKMSRGAPGVLGIWGEWLFIFRELGSTGNYFRGAREQAHSFWDTGSLAKKQKNKEKPPFCLIFLKKKSSASGRASPQTPLVISKCNYFHTNMLI